MKDFRIVKNMPSDGELRSFISKYNLYSDWKIDKDDVRQDITCQILNYKISDKQRKSIISYKEYFIKLKEVFGIPKFMPEDSEIEDFITDYGLDKNWGINVKDVYEDLEKIISGKYDEFYKDSVHEKKLSVYKLRQQLYSTTSSTQRRIPARNLSFSSTLKNISCNSEETLQKTARLKSSVMNGLSSKSAKQKAVTQPEKKIPKLEKTIFIDGDNNINEGQKGIENTSKDVTIIAFFSQLGAQKKFDMKYRHKHNVSSIFVPPGNQAVDNRIKTKVGQLLKKKNQDITIVSQDTDFKKYIDKKRNNNLKNKISVTKSVAEKLKIDKNRKNL